ncbi:penicillin-binding transpeptidase domain-containing protein [Escherichia coli]
MVVTDPRTGWVLALVSTPSHDRQTCSLMHLQQTLFRLVERPEYTAGARCTQGVEPPASQVKPYRGGFGIERRVITRKPPRCCPRWWQLPGSEKRYRDWKNGATGV